MSINISNASDSSEHPQQGWFDRFSESIKSLWHKVTGGSSSSDEGEKRLEHYDEDKNKKLEAEVNGPKVDGDEKEEENGSDVTQSEEFTEKAYPDIKKAAADSAPSQPKQDEKQEAGSESGVKEELKKEEEIEQAGEDGIYADMKDKTGADQVSGEKTPTVPEEKGVVPEANASKSASDLEEKLD